MNRFFGSLHMLAFALEDAAAQKDAVVRGPKKGPYAASAIVLDGLFLTNAHQLLPCYTIFAHDGRGAHI